MSYSEIDDIFPRELRHETEQRLALGKKVYQINLFSGVAHGFAVRGDLSIAANRWSKEQALLQALAWFEYHL
jgi:hypothetical protein